MIRLLMLAVLLFITSLELGLSPVLAALPPLAEGAHLLTSSLPTSLIADPGTTVKTAIRINNTGVAPEPIKVRLLKFLAYGDQGQPQLLDRQPGDDYFDWVHFDTTNFTLAPEEWKTINVTINLPKTAAFGYYYAVSFNEDAGKPGSEQTGFGGGIASLILLEARSPNTVRQAAIAEFTSTKKLYTYLPTSFTVKMTNTGNIHVAPIGNIFINQGSNLNIGVTDVNKAVGAILPGSSRVFTSEWQDGFPVYQSQIFNGNTVLDDKGNAAVKLHWDFNNTSKFRFGQYTAHLVMTYDNGSQDVPLEATTSFWVVPWPLIITFILIGLLVLSGLFGIIRGTIRRFANR